MFKRILGVACAMVVATSVAAAQYGPFGLSTIIAPKAGAPSDTVPFTALHTFFMSPTGNDSNNGSVGAPWLTPFHSVVCGDVIIAAPGAYSGNGLGFGSVSNCPSTTGGIDGAGGIYAAVLLCAGPNVGACTINFSPSSGTAMRPSSNWAIEGWKVSSVNVGNSGGRAFESFGPSPSTLIHHTAYINNITSHVQQGFACDENAQNHNVPGNGCDYWSVVGNIAFDSANDIICLSAIDAVAPAPLDSAAGTHMLVNGNFVINSRQASGCGSDGEAIMFDTWDAHGFTGQGVIKNNIAYSSAWANSQIFMQGFNSSSPTIKEYNNTYFNGNVSPPGNPSVAGDMNHQLDGGFPWTLRVFNNISKTNRATAGTFPENVYALLIGGAAGPAGQTIAIGGTGLENIANGVSGQNTITFNGYTMGANFTTDPQFKSTADLLANHMADPNCTGFETTTACMGWNHATRTVTSLSVIDDVTAQAANAAGKGYQVPGNCAPDADYPTWLKGLVYLHWDGSNLTERAGLVNKPCGL